MMTTTPDPGLCSVCLPEARLPGRMRCKDCEESRDRALSMGAASETNFPQTARSSGDHPLNGRDWREEVRRCGHPDPA